MDRIAFGFSFYIFNIILNIMSKYLSISEIFKGQYKDKGSKFFAYLIPSITEEAFKKKLASIKKEHFKARHFCYGFRIGIEAEIFRSTDDGEPSGTAGKPILSQLEKHNLVNAAIVVVRYFGGTKLGVSGLIKAYRGAAVDAIQNARIEEFVVIKKGGIAFPYEKMGAILEVIKTLPMEIVSRNFELNPSFIVSMEESEWDKIWVLFKSKMLMRPPQDITYETKLPGIQINEVP